MNAEEEFKSYERKKAKCEVCNDTGFYGDNGPGKLGNSECCPCECRLAGKSERQKTESENLIESLRTRIAELEDKLRWRDCKTEPPDKNDLYLCLRRKRNGII